MGTYLSIAKSEMLAMESYNFPVYPIESLQML